MDIEDYLKTIYKIKTKQTNIVKKTIKIGKSLEVLKYSIKYGRWSSYVEQNLSITQRKCQQYMLLAKYPIAEKYYKLGVKKLLKQIREGVDLS